MTDNRVNSANPETLAAQALGVEDHETGAVVPAIHTATTYVRDDAYNKTQGRSYIRNGGPSQEHAEDVIATLERGQDALCFSSGIAACVAPFHALRPGDGVAVSRTIYHGVLTWLEAFGTDHGLRIDYYDTGDLDQLGDVLRQGRTTLVWLETPANPVWTVTDIRRAAKITHDAGAQLAVDSTCATPVLSRPIELGADFVCHSATKFLNGHSDVLAGVLVSASKDDNLWARIREHRTYAGPVLGSFEAYLLVRGMRTLFLRVPKQSETALVLARYLETHSGVEAVHYPGLRRFPGHEIAVRQMEGGFGGMLSFQVVGGRTRAIDVARRVRVFKRATSLGGVESLLEHRKSSESDITTTPDNLIRISTGIENPDDLLADLEQALSVV